MSSAKGTPPCCNKFLYDVLSVVKQWRIRKYFLSLLCVDLRWEELTYIINKLNNLGLCDR